MGYFGYEKSKYKINNIKVTQPQINDLSAAETATMEDVKKSYGL